VQITLKPTATSQKSGISRDEAMQKLKEIKELLDMGILTQEEFDAKKQEYMKFL